jgi:V8-like Glu-specific endopeptidase
MDERNREVSAADPRQDQMDAAERLARLVAGDDDERFILVFQSLVNLVDGFLARPGEQGVSHARSTLLRTAEPHVSAGRRGLRAAGAPPGLAPDSIFRDPVFLQNAKKLISERTRIVGGVPTADFPDCVAVGTETGWCCTGTLVARNVVVTAGHCVVGGCASRVFV